MRAIKYLHRKIKVRKTAKVSFPNAQETEQTAEHTRKENKLWLERHESGADCLWARHADDCSALLVTWKHMVCTQGSCWQMLHCWKMCKENIKSPDQHNSHITEQRSFHCLMHPLWHTANCLVHYSYFKYWIFELLLSRADSTIYHSEVYTSEGTEVSSSAACIHHF